MIAVIKPPPLRPAVEGGYTLDDFDIDEAAGTITCPAGITVTITPARIGYFKRHWDSCSLRHRCTTAAGGRTITLHPHHDLLAEARVQARTEAFGTSYRQHLPMIERSIAWLVARSNRRLRYLGIERNRLWLTHRCAAINLRRLTNLGLTHHYTWAIA